MSACIPAVGDWFCLPQSIEPVDRNAPLTKEHRWIVASHLHDRIEFPVVLRSTSPGYDGTPHRPHGGSCGVADCRIDEHGWISHTRTAKVPISELTGRWSCREPDLDVQERVMEILERVHRTRQQRSKGTRRKRR